MEEQVKILEEKYKDIAQLKEMKERVRILKEELMWAIVRDKTLVCYDHIPMIAYIQMIGIVCLTSV